MSSRRLVAILAADIAGYSALMGADEDSTVRDLKAHQSVLLPMIEELGGHVIDTAGDGILADFGSVLSAVECALAMQQRMAERNAAAAPGRAMHFRIGINQGDVIVDDGAVRGDGVNVAARLQSLAEPGGICISGKVFDEVGDRLPAVFIDQGEQQLKNIARPTRVFSCRAAIPTAPRRTDSAAAMAGDRPSIAVLPFENMSGDPEQVYFSDGITEDIITALSRFSSLFVIARNSSFAYKGRSVDIVQIGRELSVRYVLEGSIRKAGSRIRVTAQLIEAATGGHVWGERYDRELTDIFMVQDELSRAIVSTLTAYVAKLSADAAMRQPIERLAAYDLYLRGREMLREWVPSSDGGRCIVEARNVFRQGATADPRYARSLIGLSECDVCAWVEPSPYGSLMDDYQNAEVLNRALVFAQKAVSLDGSLDEARAQLGWVLHWKRRIEESVREYDRAFALNPNMTDRHYGNVLAKAGRALDAIAYIRDVMSRDPFYNEELLAHLGHALYLVEQYEEAAEVLRRCVRAAPDWRPLQVWLAAACAQMGSMDEARIAAQHVRRIEPAFTIARWVGFEPYARPQDAGKIAEGLCKAGLPEH